MSNQHDLEALFIRNGFTDFRWLNAKNIIVAHWVRMKCTFGCSSYGRNACCPPNTPSVEECRQFIGEYANAVVFHLEKAVEKPEDRTPWARDINRKFVTLEREVFLSGYQKAFMLIMDSCELCDTCATTRNACLNPKLARPTPEGFAIDVFATVHKCGYPISVLADYSQSMNRYAFLLLD